MDIKPILFTLGATFLVLGGAIWWIGTRPQPPQSSGDIISTNGLHWHPKLTIYAKGEEVSIPQGIGLAGGHKPIHTHDDLPIIHLEFSGMVRTGDVTLAKFFDSWGKNINSLGTGLKMTVNGQNNVDFEKYVMKDGDEIVLRYDE